jgi:hypothetical protein
VSEIEKLQQDQADRAIEVVLYNMSVRIKELILEGGKGLNISHMEDIDNLYPTFNDLASISAFDYCFKESDWARKARVSMFPLRDPPSMDDSHPLVLDFIAQYKKHGYVFTSGISYLTISWRKNED